ncbi:MAG: hypoxanthine phosphoribosyltransferase [Bdellovibrionales bacterium]
MLKDSMMTFLTREEISTIVKRLAREIENDYVGREVVMICPLKGSVHFAADLMREIRLFQQIDFVYVSSGRREAVKIIKDISLDITNKHVLILEEIIDAGRTLSFLRDRLVASGPASLRIVTLLDKPARRELPIRADYIGKTIDDRYVVGYGMDTEELGRNYSDIYNFRN